MDNKNNIILIKELKKHELCNSFWSEQVNQELEKQISLQYEPIGEMGIYSKSFHFRSLYSGDKEFLLGTEGIIDIKISSNIPEYDIQKAINNIDCFHNVQIKVKKGEKLLLSSCFRLWDNQEEQFCGDKNFLNIYFNS